MKILIYGAGAVGTGIGGLLSGKGAEVHLIGRRSLSEAVKKNGLVVNGILGRFESKPEVFGSIEDIINSTDSNYDLVILTVKSFDTENSAKELSGLKGDFPILHLQNGIGNFETLIKHFSADRIFTGMIIIGFTVIRPGETRITVYGGDTKIGQIGRPVNDEIKKIVKIFDGLPIRFDSADFVESFLYAKLLYNASLNPLGAILRVNYGHLMLPASLDIIKKIIEEAYLVIRAKKIPVLIDSPTRYYEHLISNLIPATADHRPSMLVDLEAGKRTEIDYINGALLTFGDEHSLNLPVNRTLVNQIKVLEALSRENSMKA